MTIALTLDHLGLAARTTSEVSVEHASRLAATIDASGRLADGDALPLLWHWAYFTPDAPTADLGVDGHPRLPAGPLSPYPRRMWASGTVSTTGQLVVGVPATRTTGIVGARESTGRSGAMAIVTLEHRYSQDGADRIVEEQTLVYREAGPTVPLPSGDYRPTLEGDQWSERHAPDSKLLFRFSSVTFNTHRIHFDQPYATTVEGYPALVVHGPLTALLVGESIQRVTGRQLARFEFRATAPLFVDAPFTIVGTSGAPGEPVTARVVRNDGTEAMEVSAQLAG